MVGIRTSIIRMQNTVVQYIATRPIMDLCKQATRRPGARVSRRWWEQTGIDLKGAREKAELAATETETESESEDKPDRSAGGGGEEDSQEASASSGAEWSGAEDD